jgi:hypothetical protein
VHSQTLCLCPRGLLLPLVLKAKRKKERQQNSKGTQNVQCPVTPHKMFAPPCCKALSCCCSTFKHQDTKMATAAAQYSAACSHLAKHCRLAHRTRHTHIHNTQLCLRVLLLLLAAYIRSQYANTCSCPWNAGETQPHNPIPTLTHAASVATGSERTPLVKARNQSAETAMHGRKLHLLPQQLSADKVASSTTLIRTTAQHTYAQKHAQQVVKAQINQPRVTYPRS